ncbi:MAG: hypothetical protein L6R38_007752 [Xanthoria sp. 2 TBL-2021]|nr:MAG: hypothetical protein L6R38_007752 [Xanthoria sp. 2 TBL-2021]
MIPRRDYNRELYRPKKDVTFDDGRYHRSQSRSRSSRSSRRRRHSRYSDSSDSDSDSDSEFWSEAERQTSAARNKKLLYTGLATVTSIGAVNGLYQSTKAHQQRARQLREGTLSKSEAADLKKEHCKRGLISAGLIAVSLYNTHLGWQRMKGKQVEEQKIRDEYDMKRNKKVRDEYDIERKIRA